MSTRMRLAGRAAVACAIMLPAVSLVVPRAAAEPPAATPDEASAAAPPLSLAVDGAAGLVDSSASPLLDGWGTGVSLEAWLTRGLALGVRYQLLGLGLPQLSAEASAGPRRAGHAPFVTARYRLFTDEAARTSWTLGAGAGYAFVSDELGGRTPLGRVTLGRELGSPDDDATAMLAALELIYLHGFDAGHIRAVLLGLRFGVEMGIRAPRNQDTRDPEDKWPGFHYTLGGNMYLPTFGWGISWGLPVVRGTTLSARVDNVPLFSNGVMYTAVAGVRQRSPWPAAYPLYAEVQAGYGLVTGAPPPFDHGIVADAELGLYLVQECRVAFRTGVRLRTSVDQSGLTVRTGFLTMTVEAGSGEGSLGDRPMVARKCPGSRTVPIAPPPPVDVTPPRDIDVDIDVDVEIEPVIIEVPLGRVLLGGTIRLDIRAEMLPLDRLRGAGVVNIEIVAPARVLADTEARLRAALDRDGVRVDAITRTPAPNDEVRLVIELWPPGTRQ